MQSKYNLIFFFDDKEDEICPVFPAGCRKGRVRIDKDGCPVCDSKGMHFFNGTSKTMCNLLINIYIETYTVNHLCFVYDQI